MNDATPARPQRAIALSALVQGVGGGLGWSLVPPLLPTIAAELQMDEILSAVAWGAAPLGIALFAPIGGAVVDRFGPRRTVTVALCFGALACAARALAHDGWTFALSMLAFGAHIGFVAPAIPKALAGHVPIANLGRANGLVLLSYTLGTAVTVLLARTHLVPLLGGWREAMVAAGVAMAVVAFVFGAGLRDRGALSHAAPLRDVVALTRDRQLLRIAGIHFLLFGGYLALLGLLPKLLLAGGVEPVWVGAIVASWLLAAGIANFGGPWLSDRIGRRRPLVVAGALVAGLGLLAVGLLPNGLTLAFLVVAALGGGAFAPLLLVMPIELSTVGPARAGAALGLLMLVGQAGGFLIALASGAVASSQGYHAAIVLLAALHLAILVFARGLNETGRAAARAS